MAFTLDNLRCAGAVKPPCIVIYGTHGIGKTTLAAGAPSPVFIQTEDGFAEENEIPSFGVAETYSEIKEAIAALRNEAHEFQTVVLDSVSHAEPLVWAETCKRNNWADIESPSYGKGYDAALDVWRELFKGLSDLRNNRNMGVIVLAHAIIKPFQSPDTEAYDRYEIKLHESKSSGNGARPLIQELFDNILFVNYRVSILKDGKAPTGNKGDDRHARGTGGGQRVVYTAERPAHKAKNRFHMPAEISLPNDPSLAWSTVAQHISYYNQPAADAA